MGAKRGSLRAARLEVLAALVAAYEASHDRIELPEPIAVIGFGDPQSQAADVLVGHSQTIKRVGSADRHSRAALSSARQTLATGCLEAGPMTALPAGLKQACCEQTYVSVSTAAATGVIKNKTLGENGE
jgi:hypothetical protein